ncbi:methionyl-tRNA formyltransferase [Peristeroidobacter agariperforans]|uniref:methionyl-tRNA formyltransferase n=1 Tax=Peristeroidobacter agariperforans TaxID=268404 RepID=UPI00101C9BEF|nr:methionyl-tRNA formyltransferase [Peristeroidobacter agariperforans]
MSSQLSLIFAGTPEFSVPPLEALVASRHRVLAVYTQPDRPAGRGQQVTMSAVKQCALKHQLPVEQPPTLKDPAAVQRLAQYQADLMIVVAYGLLLPKAVLDTPQLGCVNIHASLLPRWRGAAPIQRAIQAGDEESGVTIMQMDVGLDTGPMLLERVTPIDARETGSSLHDRLSTLGAEAVIEAIDAIAAGKAIPREQPQEGATYAAKIRKEEALIDWSKSAIEIDRHVRAFNPWPIAETRWNGQQLRIWEAMPSDKKSSAAPGTVIATSSDGIEVATGAGTLQLTRVQAAGRKAMPAADFLRAHRPEGAVFGS